MVKEMNEAIKKIFHQIENIKIWKLFLKSQMGNLELKLK